MKKSAIALACAVSSVLLIVLCWKALYPDYYDPKNIQYVMWKHGIGSIDLDRAVAIMPHARWSEQLVIGEDMDGLRKRFGFLRSPNEENSHLRSVALSQRQDGEQVVFLRDSHYAVYLSNGKATRLLLIEE